MKIAVFRLLRYSGQKNGPVIRTHTSLHKVVTVILVAVMPLLSQPRLVLAQLQTASPTPIPSPGPISLPSSVVATHPKPNYTPKNVKVNRSAPHVTPPSSKLAFSGQPTDAEIFTKSPFEEPLVPIGGTTNPSENSALAKALVEFSRRTVRDDYSALEGFLAEHPSSVWKIALLTDLGWCYRQTGWYSKAMDAWQQAWEAGSQAKNIGRGKPLIDRALTELIVLNARVGRMDQLKTFIPLAADRSLEGSSKEKVEAAKQALVLMETRPDISFICGPLAVEKIENLMHGNSPSRMKSASYPSTQKGTSLIQLKADATKLGLNFIAAHRDPGAPVITPAVINWRIGHFATLIGKERGLYHIYDPTFSKDVWVSESAIDSESSGYFLVKNQALPQGWAAVTDEVAGTVWGKGTNDGGDPDCTGGPTPDDGDDGGGGLGGADGGGDPGDPGDPDAAPPSPDDDPDADGDGDDGDSDCMARYSVYKMLCSVSVRDTPLFYKPAYGPKVQFRVKYGQRESNQPSTFNYSNLGPLWTFNWLSYLTDDPNNPGADVNHYLSGGGTLVYTGYNGSTQSYSPQQQNGCVLKITSSTSYELDVPDGSKQFFTAATTTSPRKIFLTQTQDPVGNALTFSYDSNFRLVSCTDAMGQVTTVNYANTSDIYKITSVTDPFGRTATFAYTAEGYLQSSTDVSGIVSSYAYTNQAISSMTTPYGTTAFNVGQNANERWVQITDPMGAQERFETWNNYNYNTPASASSYPSGVDNSYLNLRNTFHWTKKEMQTGAGNYSDCNITHWMHETNISVMSGQVESTKKPLESRVYYNYPGQYAPNVVGTSGQSNRVTRILDDGSTQETDDSYNSLNKVSSHTDAVGRVTQLVYSSNNIDLAEIHQGSSLPGDLLASYTYYSNHLVETATDASGQTTSFTYNSHGQPLTVTDALGEVTTFAYYSSGASQGYLESVTGPQTGATTTYTWDGYGRVATITDVNGYTTSYSYDDLNRVTTITYPDSTYDQRVYTNLSLTQSKDRLGRWTRYFYNPNQQIIGILDSDNRATSYDRCSCGELKGITDPLGHRTSWSQDIEGRVVTKTFFDNSTISTTYESSTSRQKTVTDAAGQITTYNYNKDSSISSMAYTNATVATPTVIFVYDSSYPRITSMTDGTGTTNYTYNAVTSGSLGSGRLASETGPLGTTATITYTYDKIGRVTATAVNGVSSSAGFDSLGRVNTATNPLGTFTYGYVGVTPRLQSISSTNGPTTNYSYLTVNQDVRLGEIQNLTNGGTALSKFDYTYNSVGTIATWRQQQDSGTPTSWAYTYDGGDQLLSAVKTNTSTNAVITNYVYQYDLAGNRISEQIGLNVKSTSYNSLNQITGTSGAGSMQFAGTLSKPATVTINGNAASVDANNNFTGFTPVTSGTNTVQIIAKDYNNNTSTNTYQVVQPSDTASSISYDSLGNMTNNGNGQTYQWDAKNELVGITYSGSAIVNSIAQTSFTYDGLGRRVSIIEKNSSGTVQSTKQHLWIGNTIAEERSASNTVQKRFYTQGVQIGSTNYFYTRDHLGSIRELVDSTGTIQARYDYDPYGRVTLIQGTNLADFQYAGYYEHQTSGLNLTKFRAYDPNTGKWISRDPIAERGGLNLFGYCGNNPECLVDLDGLVPAVPTPSPTPTPAPTPTPTPTPSPTPTPPSAIQNAQNLGLDPNTNRSDGTSTSPYVSHYGGNWDPNQDSNSNGATPTGNHNNHLNSNSLAISANVAAACHLHVGDPVYANGHYLGNYDDTAPEDNTIDAYDPSNAVNNTGWGGTVRGGSTITNHP